MERACAGLDVIVEQHDRVPSGPDVVGLVPGPIRRRPRRDRSAARPARRRHAVHGVRPPRSRRARRRRRVGDQRLGLLRRRGGRPRDRDGDRPAARRHAARPQRPVGRVGLRRRLPAPYRARHARRRRLRPHRPGRGQPRPGRSACASSRTTRSCSAAAIREQRRGALRDPARADGRRRRGDAPRGAHRRHARPRRRRGAGGDAPRLVPRQLLPRRPRRLRRAGRGAGLRPPRRLRPRRPAGRAAGAGRAGADLAADDRQPARRLGVGRVDPPALRVRRVQRGGRAARRRAGARRDREAGR